MKKGLTEVVFILDRSGSMAGLVSDTVGGYNSMLKKQRAEAGEALISTVVFDDVSEVIHDRVPIERVMDITEREYYARGCTALLDAVGGAIHHIGNVHKYTREEDVPERTLFIITTDGMENASRRYSYRDVKDMIERQQKKYGWEFLFLGANIDAARMGESIGIDRKYSVDYLADTRGTELNFDVLSEAVSRARCCAAPLDASWKRKIDKDRKTRGRKR